MSGDGILERIEALHPWMVPARFAGVEVVPGLNADTGWTAEMFRNHCWHRTPLLVDRVHERVGLKDARLLDVACNCGYFSARHAETGRIGRVLGVDGRREHVEQAHLYWSDNRFMPEGAYDFRHGDLLIDETWAMIEAEGPFDISLCAGILYHVADYQGLLERILGVTREAVVIDTRITHEAETAILEPRDLRFNALAHKLEKVVPRLDRIAAILTAAGWTWTLIPPGFPSMPGLDYSDDYTLFNRVAILARRAPAERCP
ncbi:MAG TPA: methyltransferase domain-containing protein [Hyphomicrobium sp.]|nr:methyltransferase domain-containing protein [Hyphomicrobium sp.]